MKSSNLYKIVLIFICAIIPLIVSTGCSDKENWTNFRGNNGQGNITKSISTPLAIKWKLKLQFSDENLKSFNPPVIYNEKVYFGSEDGNFYSLDLKTGYMSWIFKSRASVNSVPFVDEKHIYFGSNDGNLYALSRETGEELWAFQTKYTVQSLIVRHKDLIIFTSDRGNTHFLTIRGEEIHSLPNPIWSYHTFQVYDEIMYWAPGPPNSGVSFGAYDINNKNYLWVKSTETGLNWYSFPALDKEKILYSASGLSSTSNNLNFIYYSVNRLNGKELWTYEDTSYFGGKGTSLFSPKDIFLENHKLLDYLAPTIWKNLVIYTSGDAIVRAFNINTGKLAWQHTFQYPTSSAPTIAGNRIYFGVHGGDQPNTDKPRLVCLSTKTGKLQWELELDGNILSAPVITGTYIIFGTDKSFFYILEEVF